jgi:G protein-coupled receptor GPR1
MYLYLKRSETIRQPLLAILSGHTIHTLETTESAQSPRSLSGVLIITTTTLKPGQHDKGTQNKETEKPEVPALEKEKSKSKKEKEVPGMRQRARQRAKIHRQLRLMFIYPLVYTLMWLLPFVQHCMMCDTLPSPARTHIFTFPHFLS